VCEKREAKNERRRRREKKKREEEEEEEEREKRKRKFILSRQNREPKFFGSISIHPIKPINGVPLWVFIRQICWIRGFVRHSVNCFFFSGNPTTFVIWEQFTEL